MRFYINKLQIDVSYSFLLIIAFSMLSKGYSMLYVLLFSCLHEMGHLILLYALGGRAKRLTLAFYGIGLIQEGELSNFRQIIFLMGGISVNLIFVLLNVKRDVNSALLIINALPVYPLDGGRILKLALNGVLSLNLSDKIFALVSILIIAIFIFLAIYLKNASLLFIAVYVIAYSINNSTD